MHGRPPASRGGDGSSPPTAPGIGLWRRRPRLRVKAAPRREFRHQLRPLAFGVGPLSIARLLHLALGSNFCFRLSAFPIIAFAFGSSPQDSEPATLPPPKLSRPALRNPRHQICRAGEGWVHRAGRPAHRQARRLPPRETANPKPETRPPAASANGAASYQTGATPRATRPPYPSGLKARSIGRPEDFRTGGRRQFWRGNKPADFWTEWTEWAE
jgi:hypothetical protein